MDLNPSKKDKSEDKRRGNRMLMPLPGSTFPTPALCTGDLERSAHLTSHTWQ
ncbi:unnamed protein product [Choristocarpus tenellus]